MKPHTKQLTALGACSEAIYWAANQPDMVAVWANCERGDWMLWLLGKLSGEPESPARKHLVFIAAQCARETLPIFEEQYSNDKRVRECIKACEAYSRGEITMAELRSKRADATYAAYAAALVAYASAYAAYASSYAALVAYAADAALVAYASAYAAAADMRKRYANIVRQHYSEAPVLP